MRASPKNTFAPILPCSAQPSKAASGSSCPRPALLSPSLPAGPRRFGAWRGGSDGPLSRVRAWLGHRDCPGDLTAPASRPGGREGRRRGRDPPLPLPPFFPLEGNPFPFFCCALTTLSTPPRLAVRPPSFLRLRKGAHTQAHTPSPPPSSLSLSLFLRLQPAVACPFLSPASPPSLDLAKQSPKRTLRTRRLKKRRASTRSGVLDVPGALCAHPDKR